MADSPVEYPFTVRYMEVDQQGVVFNSWYLTYFDEAMAYFLAERGYPYARMTGAGYDTRLVHTELDWREPLRYGDEAVVAVATAAVGRTSFTLDFEVRRAGAALMSARTVYVVVTAPAYGKAAVPDALRDALGEPSPLRP